MSALFAEEGSLLCFRAPLFIDDLWPPAGIGILGQVWYLIVSFPHFCPLFLLLFWEIVPRSPAGGIREQIFDQTLNTINTV